MTSLCRHVRRTPEMADRIDEFRSRFLRLGLDAYWVVSPVNVRYLTGFRGQESTLIVDSKRSFLITDFRYLEQAGKEAQADEIVSRDRPMAVEAAVLCKKLGVRKIGIAARNVTHADWTVLQKELPGAELRPVERGIVERMRLRKTPAEVEAIRAALAVSEKGLLRCLERLRPGHTERWVAATLEYEMRLAGAEGPAFDTICAADAHASLPHYVTGGAQIAHGSSLLIDWGATVDGYNSDLTRVVGVGKMRARTRELAEIVLAAQEAALERVGPGVPRKDVDGAARAVIAKAGYGRCFGHALGHGVGLEVHEGPRLGPEEKEVLLPGMVLTVEPAIYLPGTGGVRIEEMVVVTDSGCQVLSTVRKKPWVVGVS